ncbi:MAG TPA: 16S rRNA pseudouridine(516) synthase [Longimicrobiales bacterium]|nr:16S rRNA pseudouridine(516) synthase [Longimicrobiales bacterium]
MMARGRVRSADGRILHVHDDCAHADVRIDGAPLDPPRGAVIMLHKPAGYVCSTRDANPLVYDLLPPRFPLRSPVIAPVGRLDADTTGLLLLTDDGALNHRITSPRSHLPKVYDVTLADDLTGAEAALFASGTLVLKGEATPLLPAALEVLDARRARITLHEGRYHQVRRMFAAVGNHVVALHRSALGGLTLGDLPTGAWRVLEPHEVAALTPARAGEG